MMVDRIEVPDADSLASGSGDRRLSGVFGATIWGWGNRWISAGGKSSLAGDGEANMGVDTDGAGGSGTGGGSIVPL
jgi:hypothetical protein